MNRNLFAINAALLLFSTIISFFCIEIALRYYLFGAGSLSPKKMNSTHPLGLSGLVKKSRYSEVVYELKPNLETYFKLASFKTNSFGMRDKEYEIAKPNNSFRIAVIGDSFTLPAGVRINGAYHTLVENRLNAEENDRLFEILNFSVSGYSLRQYWAVLNLKVKQFNPDQIIIGFCSSNDHKIPPNRIFQEPFREKPKTYPFYHSFVVKGILRYFKNRKVSNMNNDNVIFSRQEMNYMSEYFSKFQNYSDSHEIPVLIALISNSYQEKYSKKLRNLVEKKNLYFTDLSLAFKKKNNKEYRIFPHDRHPNEKANKIFGNHLYVFLKENDLLGEGNQIISK